MERKGTKVPATMVHRWTRAPLSCALCRAKKLRCDRAQPCSNCLQRKATCVYGGRGGAGGQAGSSKAPSTSASSPGPVAQQPTTVPPMHQPEENQLLDRIQRLEQMVYQRPDSMSTLDVRSDFSSPPNKGSSAASLTDEMEPGHMKKSVTPFGSQLPMDLQPHLNAACYSGSASDTVSFVRCLPPLVQARELFNHFTCCMQPTFGVLHIPSTRALMEQTYQTMLEGEESNTAGIALLFSMFAGAALAWTPQLLEKLQATQAEATSAFTAYSHLALLILDNKQQAIPCSTVALQAIGTLIYVLSHTDGFSDKVHMLRVRELLMARSMQIHRLDTETRREERSAKGFNVVEIEVQRRIWWHMVSSDWLLALSGGPQEGVYLLQPNHMKVNYPSNIDDETIPASGTQYGFPLSIPTSMSAFLYRIRLAELCREVVDTMPTVLLESPALFSKEVNYDLILDLDAKFQAFLHAMPIFFKLDPLSMQQSLGICRERPYIAWQRTFLHFSINTRICRLHRPFHMEGFTNPKYAYSRMMCIRSAETVLSLRRSMDDIGALINLMPSRFWLVVQHVFLAAIILATEVSLRPDAPEAETRKEEVLAACQMLERSQHESTTLKKAIQKNTRTLLMILQNQISLPTSSSQGCKADSADIAMTGDLHIPHANTSEQASVVDPNSTTMPTMMGTMLAPSVQGDGSTSRLSSTTPNYLSDEETWGQLWSDMFNAGLDVDMPQWSSLLNDMEFTEFSSAT